MNKQKLFLIVLIIELFLGCIGVVLFQLYESYVIDFIVILLSIMVICLICAQIIIYKRRGEIFLVQQIINLITRLNNMAEKKTKVIVTNKQTTIAHNNIVSEPIETVILTERILMGEDSETQVSTQDKVEESEDKIKKIPVGFRNIEEGVDNPKIDIERKTEVGYRIKEINDQKKEITIICNDISANITCFVNYQNGEKEKIDNKSSFIISENCNIVCRVIIRNEETNLSINISDFKVSKPIITENNRKITIEHKPETCVCYTTDGSTPSSKLSERYLGSFDIKSSCTIKAIAVRSGWNDSDVESLDCVVVPTPEERIRIFTQSEQVLGLSYRGDGHLKTNKPCQDYHSFQRINKDWCLAIVSDGAGSAEHSDSGSKAVCAAFTSYVTKLVEDNSSFKGGAIPTEKVWDLEFRDMLNRFQNDLVGLIKSSKQDIESKSLAATIIVLLYSSQGYLIAHVGDGRAAVKVNGEWKAIFTPHKGEEANQTIFSTTLRFSEYVGLKMSGNYVPETHACSTPFEAFALMSDGCESGLWHMNEKIDLPNGDFKIKERNIPFSKGLNDALEIISCDDPKKELLDFIRLYNNSLSREIDDKTLLIGKVL